MTFEAHAAVFVAVAVGGALTGSAASVAQTSSQASPDPVRGARLFGQCRACHTVAPRGAHTIGPNLAGITGTKAGTRPGFSYSPALAKSGLVWNAVTLDAFLKRPNQAVPGTKMVFGGMPDAPARADVIAYLATLKSSN